MNARADERGEALLIVRAHAAMIADQLLGEVRIADLAMLGQWRYRVSAEKSVFNTCYTPMR
jgi:hypothetical protein